jgi:DNA-binding MarR family transcriptional regulator
VEAGELGQALEVTSPTANDLIKVMIEKGILSEITGQQRGRVYSFNRYLDLFIR